MSEERENEVTTLSQIFNIIQNHNSLMHINVAEQLQALKTKGIILGFITRENDICASIVLKKYPNNSMIYNRYIVSRTCNWDTCAGCLCGDTYPCPLDKQHCR